MFYQNFLDKQRAFPHRLDPDWEFVRQWKENLFRQNGGLDATASPHQENGLYKLEVIVGAGDTNVTETKVRRRFHRQLAPNT